MTAMYTDLNKKIADLIYRDILGRLNDSGKRSLQDWIDRSDDHRRMYEELRSGEAPEYFIRNFSGVTGAEIVAGIKSTIRERNRRRRSNRIAAASVSAAAVLVAGMLVFRYIAPGGDIPAVATLEAHPAGMPQAILSYGDNRVMLTGEEQGAEWEKYIEPAAAEQAAQQVQRIRIETPRGGEYKLRLSDGTQVWLNSESGIEYPQEFAAGRRTVKLIGEAYFEVTHDAARPFYVDFGDARIKVLGTSFNVSAYADDNAATATLVSGLVEVSRHGAVAELTPGRQAVMASDAPGIIVNEVDATAHSSWTKGIFEFENMRLEDICSRLSRWYDVDFEFTGRTGDEKFTGGTWKYLPLGEFLNGIAKVTDVRFSYADNKVVVSAKR